MRGKLHICNQMLRMCNCCLARQTATIISRWKGNGGQAESWKRNVLKSKYMWLCGVKCEFINIKIEYVFYIKCCILCYQKYSLFM